MGLRNDADTQTVTLTKDKETKNTVRFTVYEGDVTGSLYVQKTDPRSKRDSLTITLPAQD